MKLIGVTQKEINQDDYSYDCLDIRWLDLFDKCGLIPILIPNNILILQNMLNRIHFDGFLLTGGGLIKNLGGNERRDSIENLIIESCIEKNKPLIGVCRGMQKIQSYFKIPIYKVNNHVMQAQKITINNNNVLKNSFHDYGTKENNDEEFRIWANSSDNVVKGIDHLRYKISGIMWHPERLSPFHEDDLKYFNSKYQ